MNTQKRERKAQHKAGFDLESLEDRIVPSAVHVAAGAVAGVSAAQSHEQHLAQLAMKHAGTMARHEHHHAGHQQAAGSAIHAPVTVGITQLSHRKASSRAASRGSASLHPVGIKMLNDPRPVSPGSPVIVQQPAPTPTVSPGPTPAPISPSQVPANVAQPLHTIYAEYAAYVDAGGTGTFTSSLAKVVVMNGTNVGVQFHWNGTGDFSAFIAGLQSDGVQVIDSSSTFGLVEGMLPMSQLPTVAVLPQTLSLTPMYIPMLS
jgi:hypothetical protein